MSPYAVELALARVEAMQALRADLREATNAPERRRLSTVIVKAPKPTDIDNLVQYVDKKAKKDVVPVPQADPRVPQADPRGAGQPVPSTPESPDIEPSDPCPAPLDPDEDPLPESVDPEVLLAISPAIDVPRFQHNPSAMPRPLRNLLRAQLQLREHHHQPQPRAP